MLATGQIGERDVAPLGSRPSTEISTFFRSLIEYIHILAHSLPTYRPSRGASSQLGPSAVSVRLRGVSPSVLHISQVVSRTRRRVRPGDLTQETTHFTCLSSSHLSPSVSRRTAADRHDECARQAGAKWYLRVRLHAGT